MVSRPKAMHTRQHTNIESWIDTMAMEGDGAGAGGVSVLRNHLPSQLGLWPELLCVVKVKWTVMDFESSNLHNLNAKRISTLDARFLFSTCASRVQCSVYYMSCLPGCSAVLLLAASLKLFKNETQPHGRGIWRIVQRLNESICIWPECQLAKCFANFAFGQTW